MDVKSSRMNQIEDLYEFVDGVQLRLNDVLADFGWSESSLFRNNKVHCPVNGDHWISDNSLSKHVETCSWQKDGYSKEEMEQQPPSSYFAYCGASSVIPIVLDKELLTKVLTESPENAEKEPNSQREIKGFPRTMDHYCAEFTPSERLTIYDYVVKQGKSTSVPNNVTVEDLIIDFENRNRDEENRPKSKLELMAEQRDYKRRRQSYRAKNVHITKKSYTEVMKEVIENQITYLAETRKQEETVTSSRSEEQEETESIDSMTEKNSGSRKNSSDEWEERSHHSRKKDRHSRHRHKHSRIHSKSHKKHKHHHHKKHYK